MPKPEADAPAPAPEAVPEAPAAEAVPAPEPTKVDLAIKAWLDEHILNSPVSRSTDAYNHLVSVLPQLAASLEG
jgi:hypothetical protein